MTSAHLLAALLISAAAPDASHYSSTDTLSRIRAPGYVATVLCSGILGADGLALSDLGVLYAVSEAGGKVYRVDPPGDTVVVMLDLDHPEGIDIDGSGRVYVTEDAAAGRALVLHPDGFPEVLLDGLQYPEGIAVSMDGSVFVTESSAETGSFPPFLTGIRKLDPGGKEPVFSSLYLWSLSDIVVDDSGMLYACNETSGYAFIRESVIRVDAVSGEWQVFSAGLHACEGICATPGSFFPLYVAEEDIGDGMGRVTALDRDGISSTVAEGFRNIEDVAVDAAGRIFVSEDTTGLIIMLTPRALP